MSNFDPKNFDTWGKKYFLGLQFFVNNAYHQYIQGHNIPVEPTPIFFISEVRVVFQGSPWILAFLGSGATEGLLSLVLVRDQQNSRPTSIS